MSFVCRTRRNDCPHNVHACARQVDCCALRPGRDTIRFDQDCSPEDVFATNHTAVALAA